MELAINRRAKIGLNYLEQTEQKQIRKAMKALSLLAPDEFYQNPKVKGFISGAGEKFFVYPGNKELQLVLSFQNGKCTVEDIFDHERLDHLVLGLGQTLQS